MQYEFLKNFPKRMKNVGLYGVLIQNSIQKTSWKQFGFLKFDEQMNLIFAVMLYIMEQSLREENCTMDDIGAYIDTVNTRYLGGIRELEKIEMVRRNGRHYKLDHAVTRTQKLILNSFGLDETDIKKSAEEYGKLLNSSQSYINKEAPEDGEEEDNRGN